MAERHDDLGLVLGELGERLELPAAVDPVAAAIGRIRADGGGLDTFSRPKWSPGRPIWARERVVWAAAVALLVALAATLVAPGPRHAVARWLGIGSVTVTYTDRVPASAGGTYDLGAPTPVAHAIRRADAAGWHLAAPSAAGDPARAFVGRPAGAVNLTWAPAADLPEIGDSGIGLLLTEVPATTDAGGVAKMAPRGTTIELVRVGDEAAYWIAGRPHEVVLTDADGDVVHDSSRLAGNTLIWTDGEVTYRLESALDRDDAVALASTLRRLS
ncbi:MAG TPA: hypothetical protein VKD21_08850 [Acidimicrobiales bacterium]|nr:hypothetical protein [Acidimicrobiales bacterium]